MNSPFSHLFQTNYAASAAEIPVIHDLLSERLEKLVHINCEIERLETTLANLKRDHDDISSYIDEHKKLLPFRRLPAEILSEIFVHCLPKDRNPMRSLSEAPLLLGRICRSWREVSLTTPHLWSSIHVDLPRTAIPIDQLCRMIDARRCGVESWLDKSGSLPLSFSIYGNSKASEIEEEDDLELFS
ncbi:hypothetical protein VKT23_001543 [Stygiomarasmius scandens]|uniref:F-box domain-containing protein n=1 Tax=Marasmiellus scandens TaxID=2682957 RepID=A0ABR1K3C7_9AGAR